MKIINLNSGLEIGEKGIISQVKRGVISLQFKMEDELGLDYNIVQKLNKFTSFSWNINGVDKSTKTNGVIQILLSEKTKYFDPLFIATLCLMKSSFPRIEFAICINNVDDYSKIALFFQLGQVLIPASAFSETSSLPIRFIADGKDILPTIRNIQYFFVSSRRFMPLVIVNEKTYAEYFKNPFIESWSLLFSESFNSKIIEEPFMNERSQKKPFWDTIYKTIISHIQKPGRESIKKGLSPDFVKIASAQGFLRTLRDVRALRTLLQEYSPDCTNDRIKTNLKGQYGIGIKGFNKERNDEWQKIIQEYIDSLLEKPIVFVMLFSLVIINAFSFKQKENNEITESTDTIEYLFRFTEELFDGIRELAKNICEHSSSGTGFLVFRAFDYDRLSALKHPALKKSLKKSEKSHAYINISIVDISDSGLLMKMEEKLNGLSRAFSNNSKEHSLIKHDLKKLMTRHAKQPKGRNTLDRIGLHSFFNLKRMQFLHQNIRTSASMGLIIFSDLLVRNDGYAFISTRDREKTEEIELSSKGVSQINQSNTKAVSKSLNVPFGTYYDLSFPVKDNRLAPRTSKIRIPEKEVSVDAFEDLARLKIIDTNSTTDSTICEGSTGGKCLLLQNIEESDINAKKGLIDFTLPQNCASCTKSRQILALNITQKNIGIDASNLLRFLSSVQLKKSFPAIVIYTIDKNSMNSFKRLITAWEGVTKKSWSDSHFILFYFYEKLPNSKSSIYLPWLLAGKETRDRRWINHQIQATYPIKTQNLQRPIELTPTNKFKKNYFTNPIFSNTENMIPLDILLQNKGLSFFEWNAIAEIEQPINFGEPNATGYKFKNAHVRLGSKIHIDNFIYAKRMLQNSYYAVRFGYIIAKHIAEGHLEDEKYKKGHHKTVCILSYGLYSELLASNLARFLKLIKPETKATHAVIGDVDVNKIDHKENLKGNQVLIMVPIASTLSTATKVRDALNKNYPDLPVFKKSTNLIIVGHKDFKEILDNDGKVLDGIVKKYWKRIDLKKREITLTSEQTIQKYLLYLSAGWRLQGDCILCHPTKEKRSSEVPLVLTDPESLSPRLIFGIPQGKRISNKVPKIPIIFQNSSFNNEKSNDSFACLTKEMVYYLHIKRNSNHYRFYFDTDLLFKNNYVAIKRWCVEVRKCLSETYQKKWTESKKFIIAPSHATNAIFIGSLNSLIFQGTATIYYYDPAEDFEENLEIFFLRQIDKNSLVFFADDALCSGNTFYRIQNYLKFKENLEIGLSGSFILLNLLNRKPQEAILHDLKDNLFAFINLNAPIIGSKKENCYLCEEKNRYELLEKNSILDCIKRRWNEKITKVKTISHEEISGMPKSKELRYLRRLELIHRLYEFGATCPNDFLDIFDANCINIQLLSKKIGIDLTAQSKNENEAKATVFKVLSQPYFVLYHPIKKAVMRWCLEEIQDVIAKITRLTNKHSLSENRIMFFDEVLDLYRFLKLLLNRLSFLGSNFPLRSDVLLEFSNLNDIYRKIWRPLFEIKISEKYKIQTNHIIEEFDLFSMPKSFGSDWTVEDLVRIKKSLDNLNIYYASIVKALIDSDEGKCMLLEKALNTVMPQISRQSSFYSQLRILRVENTTILRRFIEWLISVVEIPQKIQPKIKKNIEDDTFILRNYMEEYSLWKHYRTEQIKDFLKLDEENPDFYSQEEGILQILLFFTALGNYNDESHYKTYNHPKIIYLLNLLCYLLKINPKTNGGAFCVARCGETTRKNKNGEKIYDIEQVGSTLVNSNPLDLQWENSFAYKVLDSHKSVDGYNHWTNVELIKKGNDYFDYKGIKYDSNDYHDLRRISDAANNHLPANKNFKHLLYIRLPGTKMEEPKRKSNPYSSSPSPGSGVVVFFSDREDFINEKLLRLILLTRDAFAKFVSEKFNNDTFRAWLQQEREKVLSTIMEHGINRETEAIGKIVNNFCDDFPQNTGKLKTDIEFFTKKLGNKKNYIEFLNKKKQSFSVPKLLSDSDIISLSISSEHILKYIKTMERIMPFGLRSIYPDNKPKINFHAGPFHKELIQFFPKLLEDLLFELVRNSFQNKKSLDNILNISISFRKDKKNGHPVVIIEDNGLGVDSITLQMLNHQGFSKDRKGLKMFSLLWREIFNKRLFFESVKGVFFRVTVPLYNPKEIMNNNLDCEDIFIIENGN